MSFISAKKVRHRARLMLVDDHELVRCGVRFLISDVPEWSVCAEAANAEDALKLARATKPDVVVVDISMPSVSGIDLIIDLKQIRPEQQILVFTMYEGEKTFSQTIRAGARGYVLKSDDAGFIIDAIDALARGGTFFSPSVSQTLVDGFLHPVDEEKIQLTPRERQVVKLAAEGNRNKRIAQLLGVSLKTVETHRTAAMRKIGAKSTADITLYAARNELVQI